MSKSSSVIFRNEQRSGFFHGRLLVATPMIQDSCFARSVIYLASHDEMGAMGVMVNYPVENLHIHDVLEHLEMDFSAQMRHLPVHFGGPVDANRGFVIHSSDYQSEGSVDAESGIAVSAGLHVLRDIAAGKGPQKAMLTLGYAGWSPGQLEAEIESGSWIIVPASQELVFHPENELKWELAAAVLGVDMGHFSGEVGHA